MSTPLTDRINSLISQANEATGVSDTTLSDAVESLVAGYGGGTDYLSLAIEGSDLGNYISSATSIRGGAMRDFYGSGVLSFPNATSIGGYAFGNCPNITALDLPLVTTIDTHGIYRCNSITTLYLPSFSRGSGQPIRECASLTTLVMPSAGNISQAGYHCYALEVVDAGPWTTIQQYTFENNTALTTLILRGSSVTALGNVSAFNGTRFASGGSGGTIYVPSALKSAYKAAQNWSTLDGYGTVTWASIEGSQYENYYANGIPIAA